MQYYTTKSARETQKIAHNLAESFTTTLSHHARVVALIGDLGAGKTTFVQGFAQALGVRETIQSPTFVIMKIYALTKQSYIKHLVHIDAYRIETLKEAKELGLKQLFQDKDAVIIIEWADKIKKILPKDSLIIMFSHTAHTTKRTVTIT